MKLPLLLSQYLYQIRKLDLPGIGSFVLDPNAVIPEANDRGLQTPASGISFKNINIQTPDDALIDFLKLHTGKMRSLVASDLDFFLTTGKQLLNIGKPFYLEGIGTLLKNREGHFDFTPGDYSTARLDEPENSRKPSTGNFEEAPREYEPSSNNVNTRQVILLAGLIAALVVVGWGGYHLYKRNTYVEPGTENQATVLKEPEAAPTTSKMGDSTRQAQSTDTTIKTGAAQQPTAQPPVAAANAQVPAPNTYTPAPGPGQDLYKFVILETDRKGKALRRYNQLLGYQLNIKMDQKDSSFFKLYFPIAAAARDTTHIRDSLMDVYAAKVTIER